MPRGGIRQNSGRPKGRKNNTTLEIDEARTILRNMIFKARTIAKAQLDLAQGLWYDDAKKEGCDRSRPDKGTLLFAPPSGTDGDHSN